MKNVWTLAILSAAAVFPIAVGLHADTNPNCTPADMVRESNCILLLKFQPADANGIAVAKVEKVLKGKFPQKELRVDLLAMGEAMNAQGKEVMRWIEDGNTRALFFFGGKYEGSWARANSDTDANTLSAFMHIQSGAASARWIELTPPEKGDTWDMLKSCEAMLSTWGGGMDMLLRGVEWALADPNADFPCGTGTEWDANSVTRFGRMDGSIFAAMPVDVNGAGRADLFITCDAGDCLYRWDGNALVNITAKAGITSRSALAAWGDFDGDGRLDLASWDGKRLTILWQKADGAFEAKEAKASDVRDAIKAGCLSLCVMDTGVGRKAGLLVGTKGWPVILTVSKEDGAYTARAVGAGDFPGSDLKDPGPCLAADFDGDGLIDIFQVFSDGVLFYKQAARVPDLCTFAAPVRSATKLAGPKCAACIGDFDGDGLLDVFIGGEETNRLMENQGGGRFLDAIDGSAEVEYCCKSGALFAQSGDINNDGRQDLMVGYRVRMSPQLFFNRGFRCFESCYSLDIASRRGVFDERNPGLGDQAGNGQQAACLGDFNGDGALDMVLALTDLAWMSRATYDGERGPAIAAGTTIYWDPNLRLATDEKGPNSRAIGKAALAADANDGSVSVRVDGGNLVFLPRMAVKGDPNWYEYNPTAGAIVSLPLTAPTAGPVTVRAYVGKRLLGAWSVRAGDGGAIIGTPFPATMTLKWTWTGGKAMERTVEVKDRPVRVTME